MTRYAEATQNCFRQSRAEMGVIPSVISDQRSTLEQLGKGCMSGVAGSSRAAASLHVRTHVPLHILD